MKYWDRLKQEKFVDSNFMLLKTTTRQQAMYIADLFAEKLGINNKWKAFEDFWGIKHLAQERHKMTDKGTLPKQSEIIKIYSKIDLQKSSRIYSPYIAPIIAPI